MLITTRCSADADAALAFLNESFGSAEPGSVAHAPGGPVWSIGDDDPRR